MTNGYGLVQGGFYLKKLFEIQSQLLLKPVTFVTVHTVGILQAARDENAPPSSEMEAPVRLSVSDANTCTLPDAVERATTELSSELAYLTLRSQAEADFELAPVAFLAGYVVRACEQKVPWESCIALLQTPEATGPLHGLIKKMDNGGLTYPRMEVVGLCELTFTFVQRVMKADDVRKSSKLRHLLTERGDDRVSQSTGSKCVRRVAEAVVNEGVRNKCDHFPKTPEEKAAVKEGFLRRGTIPGVIGCTGGSLIAIIAPKDECNTDFMSWKGYYAENCMFICDAGMRTATGVGSRRIRLADDMAAAAVPGGAHRESRCDSGYPLEPWLLNPVPGHPPLQTAEGKYNTAHATLRSVVERCIGLLMSRFRCLQQYRTLLYEPGRAANIVAACVVLNTQPSDV
ncbi:hypothetical protein HPB49_002705 [Dermacentor silvarum]|uniref:Uncharacterized protein n=1 Tax=Dermacentor silvarum TaxID=543639 RepID=A0ACB8DA68_DERSI|nr:hypothetical protein HPB49_002705 [Dermacentor silvarum]